MKWYLPTICAAALLLTSCSNRVRTVDIGHTPEAAHALLQQDLGVAAQAAGSDAEAVRALSDDPDTKIYFAEAPGVMGAPENVTPIELEILSPGLYLDQAVATRAYFLVRPEGDIFDAALVLWVQMASGEQISRIFFNDSQSGQIIDEELFEIQLADAAGQQLVVRSYDLDGDKIDLAEAIQLELATPTGPDEEIDRGQISTMGQL